MADKINIVSDGTVAGTKVKIDGVDFTTTYKVTDLLFYAQGGYQYVSTYSGSTIVVPPSIRYNLSYIDGDKMKSLSIGQVDIKTEYGALAQPTDALSYVGIEDKDNIIKNKLIDSLDKLRNKISTIPSKDVLEKRTVDSLKDRYEDIISELEEQAKKEKEKK